MATITIQNVKFLGKHANPWNADLSGGESGHLGDGGAVDVFVRNGVVQRVCMAGQLTPEGRSVDGHGRFILPGFFDMHVHGGGGGTVFKGTLKDYESISQTLARFGTTRYLATTFFDANGDNEHLKSAVRACGQNFGGAVAEGIYLEGPFINKSKKGMIPENVISEPCEDVLDRILDVCEGKLKVMTVAPELPGMLKLIEKMSERGIIASLGHSRANYQQTCEGINAGIRHATHLCNAMAGIHHRDVGPIPALIRDERVSVEIISDGAHINEAMIWMIGQIAKPAKICLITDGLELLGLPDGDFEQSGQIVTARGGSVYYSNGTLVGTTIGQSELMGRFGRFTGWQLGDVVCSAAITPRRVLGIAASGGDFVLADIDEDRAIRVCQTFVDGRCVYRNV